MAMVSRDYPVTWKETKLWAIPYGMCWYRKLSTYRSISPWGYSNKKSRHNSIRNKIKNSSIFIITKKKTTFTEIDQLKNWDHQLNSIPLHQFFTLSIFFNTIFSRWCASSLFVEISMQRECWRRLIRNEYCCDFPKSPKSENRWILPAKLRLWAWNFISNSPGANLLFCVYKNGLKIDQDIGKPVWE